MQNNRFYKGLIQFDYDTIYVFGSNPEGRHGAGSAKIAKDIFGAIYGIGEGLQGNSYAIPTKDLRVKENNGYRSIDKDSIIRSIQKLYHVAEKMPNKIFKVAYTNTESKSLNGYTGFEMIEMFNQAGDIPLNMMFSSEWGETNKLNIRHINKDELVESILYTAKLLDKHPNYQALLDSQTANLPKIVEMIILDKFAFNFMISVDDLFSDISLNHSDIIKHYYLELKTYGFVTFKNNG